MTYQKKMKLTQETIQSVRVSRLKRWLCWFIGHDMGFIQNPGPDYSWYAYCRRCLRRN